MMFSLLKYVRLGKLAMCVFLNVCKSMFVCTCANICAPVCFCHVYVFIRVLTCAIHIARWTDGCGMGVINSDRQYKPDKYHETHGVQLQSEVNTCLCWHKHTLNRCVIQIWGEIAAQRSASFSLKRHS